jgi:hypothetical protein
MPMYEMCMHAAKKPTDTDEAQPAKKPKQSKATGEV